MVNGWPAGWHELAYADATLGSIVLPDNYVVELKNDGSEWKTIAAVDAADLLLALHDATE